MLDSTGALSSPRPRAWEEMWRLELSRGASAPIVWADSLLLVASLDRNVHLVAPGNSPRVVWKKNFKGGFEAAPIVSGERIYLSEMRRGARLVALDRRTREIAWTAEAGDLVSPPVLSGERIYTVSSIGQVRSYDPTGTERWSTELETRVVSAPVLMDGALVVAASDGTLHALDAGSGEVRKSVDADAGPIWGHPIVRRGAEPTAIYASLDGQLLEVDADLTVLQRRSFPSRFYAGPVRGDGDRLFLIGHGGTLWAYDWEAAEVVWQKDLPGTFRTAPTADSGLLALGDLAGTFYVVDGQAGDLLWHTDLDGAITSQALAHGGVLYVITERGSLYAFRPTGGIR
ncbi:MAG TPA: PQQ-binding-like beta-propeller repeat protein [Gemmatimonadota bacterium]|nr:PQQ-binding-like beta-propeller repeat protein [Gemmatimonadota bacterium]